MFQKNSFADEAANALCILQTDEIRNAVLINIIERGSGENIMVENQSVRLKDRVSGVYMFSLDNARDMHTLVADIEEELDTFFINNASLRNDIEQRFPDGVIVSYRCFVLRPSDYDTKKKNALPPGFSYVVPDESWVEYILSRYCNKEFANRPYITGCLKNGPSLGIVKDGEKAAFVMCHLNGETGALFVDEKYRKIKLATALLSTFNGILVQNRMTAYTFVDCSNEASQMTMKSAGYTKAQEILWIYLTTIP